MPKTEFLPTPDEPKESLDELLCAYGAAATLRALARSLIAHRHDLRAAGVGLRDRRKIGEAARSINRQAELIDDISL